MPDLKWNSVFSPAAMVVHRESPAALCSDNSVVKQSRLRNPRFGGYSRGIYTSSGMKPAPP